MKDILSEIVAHKHEEMAHLERQLPTARVAERYEAMKAEGSLPGLPSMRQSLADSPTGIIAEFKRRSPSKGWINEAAQPHEVPLGYAQAGAAALSVLTDEPYFGGRLAALRAAYATVRSHRLRTPLLRKDFVVSERQLLEARILGASAVLLIAACLPIDRYRELLDYAHGLGLEVLLELHSESELPYADSPVDMVGVNNRNLGTFHTDVQNSFRLAQLLPSDKLLVSESGIEQPETIRQLREVGYRGFLIGETFMKTADPAAALSQLLDQLQTPC
ncbi:MAG: indole-3-glycerol phosphate synthase TrpC [Bacteroidaceae bacterium]|nr:indole-3-glycerol phosphate synthase TrpC [Bacteroidaceae bacterium]